MIFLPIDSNKPDMSKRPVKIGERFYRLTVLECVGFNQYHSRMYRCVCDCGKETIKTAYNLVSGKTRSCGCYRNEKISAACKTHGKRESKIYSSWHSMKQRCQNPKHNKYKDYGARGIKVCDEWQAFEPFYEWAIANGHRDDLTIDRIDVNGNYEPSNCRWANSFQQNNNKRDNVLLTVNGETHNVTEWSKIVGVCRNTIYNRLSKGFSPEQALAPVGTYASRKKVKHADK